MTYGSEGAPCAVLRGPPLNSGTYIQAARGQAAPGVASLQYTYRPQTQAAPAAAPPGNSYSSNPEASHDGGGITYPGITMSDFQELSRRVGVIENDVKSVLGRLGRIEERLSHVATKAWVLAGVVTTLVAIIGGFLWLSKQLVLSHLSH